MKLGHNKRQALEEEGGSIPVPPIRKIRAWQIGVGLFIVGNLLNFGSFAFAVSVHPVSCSTAFKSTGSHAAVSRAAGCGHQTRHLILSSDYVPTGPEHSCSTGKCTVHCKCGFWTTHSSRTGECPSDRSNSIADGNNGNYGIHEDCDVSAFCLPFLVFLAY